MVYRNGAARGRLLSIGFLMTVAFTNMTVWKAVFPLRISFAHNLAIRNEVETLIVSVGTSTGGVGYGQVLPRSYLTGESIDTALHDIRERWWPGLRGVVIPKSSGWGGALASLRPLYQAADAARATSSYAAVDIAALSAFAASTGIPVWPEKSRTGPLPLVGVVPAASPVKAALLAGVLKLLGYRHFKVKVGRDADADEARIRSVRARIGSDCRLDADANAAWTWDEAVVRMRALAASGVTLVEEPLDRECAAAADFRELERAVGMRVMVDESLCTLADAKGLLARGSPSWWNLRLAKNGGFSGLSELGALAARHGVSVYGGVLVGETGVLAAAGRAAFFGVGAACGEYGFPRFFLRGDPFRGSPPGYRGTYAVPSNAVSGLDVSLDEAALRKKGEIVWRDGD